MIKSLSHTAIRSIDIGHRARHVAPWLDQDGLLKVKVVDVFREEAYADGRFYNSY